MTKRIAALFDIDGTLIITGGAGAAAWRMAFDELYGIPADIGKFTDTGMTDPDVGHRTFAAVLGREPSRAELNKVMERRLHRLTAILALSIGIGRSVSRPLRRLKSKSRVLRGRIMAADEWQSVAGGDHQHLRGCRGILVSSRCHLGCPLSPDAAQCRDRPFGCHVPVGATGGCRDRSRRAT